MSKTLVTYFSASGATARAANMLAGAIGADTFEIRPKTPYTSADLDWTDKNARSTVEMKDKAYRPEIAGALQDIAEYKTVFVGFPIWWYIAPTIINTFLESYDFSGKTVVLFATSGGSGFGQTLQNLKPSVSDSTKIVEGKILNGHLSKEMLADWAERWMDESDGSIRTP